MVQDSGLGLRDYLALERSGRVDTRPVFAVFADVRDRTTICGSWIMV